MIKLYIDTTSNKEVIVRLTIGNKVFEEKREIDKTRTQVVLPLVKLLLQRHELTPRDLDGIEVNPGPGSFTGVRVGIAIANALAFGLRIPVNEIKFENKASLVDPVY